MKKKSSQLSNHDARSIRADIRRLGASVLPHRLSLEWDVSVSEIKKLIKEERKKAKEAESLTQPTTESTLSIPNPTKEEPIHV